MRQYDVKPKQSLGQNFLVDHNIAHRIVTAFGPNPEDDVVEIGPGYGILTHILKNLVSRLVAVEIDRRLAERLAVELQDSENVLLLQQDFLKTDLNLFFREKKLRLIGNIPYNITSPILFKAIENRDIVSDLTLLMQKEVADRIVAEPNCKEYGILSVISQAYADVKKLMTVPPTVFHPKPKVESALLQWRFSDRLSSKITDHELFRKTVRQAFGQRRKMLRKSLKDVVGNLTIEFDLTRRPESLSVEEWILFANNLWIGYGLQGS